MKPTQRAMQDVFFKAMATGWTQDAHAVIGVKEFPGSRAIPFVYGKFRVVDFYMVTPGSPKSTGFTTIWYMDQPIWTMHYGGWYDSSAIPFLKSCLSQAYIEERNFYGGRGPIFVRGERFTYVNRIEHKNFFDFSGEEEIFDLSGPQGYHWYRGGALL